MARLSSLLAALKLKRKVIFLLLSPHSQSTERFLTVTDARHTVVYMITTGNKACTAARAVIE
jgi:hypothetical protein